MLGRKVLTRDYLTILTQSSIPIPKQQKVDLSLGYLTAESDQMLFFGKLEFTTTNPKALAKFERVAPSAFLTPNPKPPCTSSYPNGKDPMCLLKSHRVFLNILDLDRVGADAWSLMYPSIPAKLQSLYFDGYKLVIFTNESNIERWKKSRQAAVDSKIGRLEQFIKVVGVPIQVFIACGLSQIKPEDPFRKPKTGMWNIMKQQFNSGVPIDMDESFFVGDAAGRKGDHSDADIRFAQAIGLKFYVPEEIFGKEN
ncbi:putative polynucleotide 3'-phosphatase ZDP-like isoform X2 [Capsicum annuum]|nr:putative polynucleotide 3'-phosphatase ZDP-like isoform X2 [Capsicum annuum]